MPGEFADMMLDGTLCQSCGAYLDESDGYPTLCAGCRPRKDRPLIVGHHQPSKPERARWRRQQTTVSWCPFCGSRKSGIALADHMRDAHQVRMSLTPIPERIGTPADLGCEVL